MKHLILLLTIFTFIQLQAKAGGVLCYADRDFKTSGYVADASFPYSFELIDGTSNEVAISAVKNVWSVTEGVENTNIYTDVEIPEYITYTPTSGSETKYYITKIAASAFQNITSITSIVIPEGVTEIGNSAFSGCTGLKSISIAMSVVTIGDDVFENCSSLKTLIIPDNVTTIGHNSFCGCTALEMIVFGEGITDIGTYDLYNNENLKVIIIKATVAPTIAGTGDGTGDTVDANGTVYGTFQNIPADCVICYPSESVGYETKEGEDGYNKQWSELVENGNAITIEEWLSKSEDNYVPATDVSNPDGSLKDEYYHPDSIRTITSSTEVVEVARYNIAGQKINGPQKGINIVVYSDGSTKKLIEK